MAIIETPSYIVLCTYFAFVGAIFSSFLYYLLYDINEYVIRFLSLHHVSAHDPSPRRYIKGIVGSLTVYQLFLSATAAIAALASFSFRA
jgi:hypothetical protein